MRLYIQKKKLFTKYCIRKGEGYHLDTKLCQLNKKLRMQNKKSMIFENNIIIKNYKNKTK